MTDFYAAESAAPEQERRRLVSDIVALGEDLSYLVPFVEANKKQQPDLIGLSAAILAGPLQSQAADGSPSFVSGSVYGSDTPTDENFLTTKAASELAYYLDPLELRARLPLRVWKPFRYTGPSIDDAIWSTSKLVELNEKWQIYLLNTNSMLWKMIYVHRAIRMYSAAGIDGRDIRMMVPLRVKRTYRGVANDYVRQLTTLGSMHDTVVLTPSKLQPEITEANYPQVVASRLSEPAVWPAPHLELVVYTQGSDRVRLEFPGITNRYYFFADNRTPEKLSNMIVTVERNGARQSFRVRHLRTSDNRFEFIEVGSEEDFAFDSARDAMLISGSDVLIEDLELRPRQLALKLDDKKRPEGPVVWSDAGAELLELFNKNGRTLLFLRVRVLSGNRPLISMDELPMALNRFELAERQLADYARRALLNSFSDLRTHDSEDRRYLGPHAKAGRLNEQSTLAMAALRLVLEFTKSTGTVSVNATNSEQLTHRSYLAHALSPVGLVSAAFLYPTEQISSEHVPVFYSGGTNSFAPNAPPCFESSLVTDAPFNDAIRSWGPDSGAECKWPSSVTFKTADILPPLSDHAAVPTSLFRNRGSADEAVPVPPPAGHPRIAESASLSVSPVWFGVYLDGLHPNIDLMLKQGEIQVIAYDPSNLLAMAGLTTLNVFLHCDYRETPADAFVRQQPLHMAVAVNMVADGRSFSLPPTTSPNVIWELPNVQ